MKQQQRILFASGARGERLGQEKEALLKSGDSEVTVRA